MGQISNRSWFVLTSGRLPEEKGNPLKAPVVYCKKLPPWLIAHRTFHFSPLLSSSSCLSSLEIYFFLCLQCKWKCYALNLVISKFPVEKHWRIVIEFQLNCIEIAKQTEYALFALQEFRSFFALLQVLHPSTPQGKDKTAKCNHQGRSCPTQQIGDIRSLEFHCCHPANLQTLCSWNQTHYKDNI